MGGVNLPDILGEFRDALKMVEDTSKEARSFFFPLMLLCAFSLLTVATTSDAQYFSTTLG